MLKCVVTRVSDIEALTLRILKEIKLAFDVCFHIPFLVRTSHGEIEPTGT